MKKLVSLILLLCLAFVLTASDHPEGGFLLQSVDASQFPRLEVRLSAWDANGVPLDQLSADNFKMQTSKGYWLKAEEFRFMESGKVNIALALDVSGSMAGQALNDAKAASYRFLDRLTTGDQAALIAFSDKVSLYKNQLNPERELDFNEDLVKVYDTIETLYAKGGTELYNAVYKAVELTSALPKGHRAVLLFSDGRNESLAYDDPEAAITLAKEEGIPVFVIGLGNDIDRAYLERLANETGGVARFTPRSSELAQTFDDMARLLKGQYLLKYELPETVTEPQETLSFSLDLAGEPIVQHIELEDLPVAEVMPEEDAAEEVAAEETEPLEEAEALYPLETEEQLEALEDEQVLLDPEEADKEDDASSQQAPQTEDEPESTVEVAQAPKTIWESFAWYWWVLAGAVLLGIIALIVSRARKAAKKPAPQSCMRCGYRMTAAELACPECGEKRVKVEK